MADAVPLADYHLHTNRCGHAVGPVAEYVEQAQVLGLAEIGFADHLPLFHKIDSSLTMSWDDLPFYLADINKLRSETGMPVVRLGVEVDYLPSQTGQIRAVLENNEFDYVVGSVHFVDGWGIDDRREIHYYDEYRLEDLYNRYFELLVQGAQSGLFDVMAHPDLIKKFFKLEPEPVHLYDPVIKAIASAGVALEFSSAGLRKPCRETYPSGEFLKICRRYDIPLTLGSDAHAPDQVGFGFPGLVRQLREVGYSELARFEGRNRIMEKIDWSQLAIFADT